MSGGYDSYGVFFCVDLMGNRFLDGKGRVVFYVYFLFLVDDVVNWGVGGLDLDGEVF